MSLFRGAFECQGYLRQFAHFRLQHFEKEKASNRYTYFLTSTMHDIPILIPFSSYISISYRVQHTCLQIVPCCKKVVQSVAVTESPTFMSLAYC